MAIIPPSCLDNGYNSTYFPEPWKQQILHCL